MSATLRRAVVEDAAAIRELTREAYAKWVPVAGREPMPMGVDYEQAVRTTGSTCWTPTASSRR